MSRILPFCLITSLLTVGPGYVASTLAAQSASSGAASDRADSDRAQHGETQINRSPSWTEQQIRDAFAKTHQGYSTDEVLVCRARCDAYLAELGIAADNLDQFPQQQAALLQLLKLRKSGRLNVPAIRRSQSDSSPWNETAEIAIRTILDRHRVSIDDVLCSPQLRLELQAEAIAISPLAPPDLIRKAVLRLRKVRKLRPELVLRVADWQTNVVTMPVNEIDFESLPESPGIYLFRSEEGYLYIGESENLSTRISQHLAGSHNVGLAKRLSMSADAVGQALTLELHVFAQDSPGSRVVMRRAYESELIRSRQPKFNLQP